MRKYFYIGNFLILGLFIAAALQDADREWKGYQKEFVRLEVERLEGELGEAKDPKRREELERQIEGVKATPVMIRQVMADDLKRYDRCVTCHMGMDPISNPSLTTPYKDHPFKSAEVAAHKAHPISKFACTSCHAGQGLATTVEDAHGFVHHWEEPMLKGSFIQASCVRCHGDYKRLHGTEFAQRGKQLIDKLGCVGCHSFNGVGGEISVDLGDIADKPVARVDWAFTGLERHDWNVQNWIMLHFTKDTMQLVPGDPEGHLCGPGEKCEPIPPSGMPPFFTELSEDDAKAVTTYLMAQTAKDLPSRYKIPAPPEPEPKFAGAKEHGKFVFEKYGCAGCHGEGGAGGRRNFNARADGQTKMEEGLEPTLTKVVGTYSREELIEKIRQGVPPTAVAKFKADGPTPPLYMPKWHEKIKGEELEDLVTYLLSIAEKTGEEW